MSVILHKKLKIAYLFNCFTYATSIVLTLQFFHFSSFAQGNSETKIRAYVWDFSYRNRSTDALTSNLTEEFEEALSQEKCVVLLERRNYDIIISHRYNELGIQDIKNIPQTARDTLHGLHSDGVIFGIVNDDVESGEIIVSAKLQTFEGQTLAIQSTTIPRGKRLDRGTRLDSMKALAACLCPNQHIDLGFRYEVLLKGLIQNKKEVANRLGFTIRFLNSGKTPISIKDVECLLKVNKEEFKCALVNQFVHAPANVPFKLDPGEIATKVYFFIAFGAKEAKFNMTKFILDKKPALLLKIVDIDDKEYLYSENPFDFLLFDEEQLNELGKSLEEND